MLSARAPLATFLNACLSADVKKGRVYSETEERCIPKPGHGRPDKS
jgi:hypothetical protein